MMPTKSHSRWAIGAFVCALIVHYVFYAFAYVWFLTGADYRTLHLIYAVFVVLAVLEFVLRAPWWALWATAWAALIAPMIAPIPLHLAPGFVMVPLGAVIAAPFIAVAKMRRGGGPPWR